MTIFDYIKDIVTKKKGDLPLDGYIPFLVTRWLSFISPQACYALNGSVNVLGNIDKNYHYKMLVSLFPKMKYTPRIQYVKKIKETKSEKDSVEVLASNMELSTREVQQMLELQKTLG